MIIPKKDCEEFIKNIENDLEHMDRKDDYDKGYDKGSEKVLTLFIKFLESYGEE